MFIEIRLHPVKLLTKAKEKLHRMMSRLLLAKSLSAFCLKNVGSDFPTGELKSDAIKVMNLTEEIEPNIRACERLIKTSMLS